ncbi:MAG TPA: YbaY family lipoprotein [Thermoanaerobaculia bacterium]|jgi:putative lipoprotein|nr:YbaY family lipoprotein [Thermoanaerobaculia bacterium]
MTRRAPRLALRIAAAFLVCLAAAASAAAEDAADAKITGTVVYRERIALPPDAIVRVRLEVAAAPEKAAKLVAQIAFPAEGRQVPIPFELPYKAADIRPEKRYLVRASVTAGDQTIWASRTPYPVLTKGAPTKLEIELQQAGAGRRVRPQAVTPAGGPVGTEKTAAPLADTAWTLVALGEQPAVAAPEAAAASLVFDHARKQISGSTGCNHFMGTYAPGPGSGLTLDPNGMTLMACSDAAMRQETAFLEALRETTAYRIEGAALELLDRDRVVARFESGGNARARTE